MAALKLKESEKERLTDANIEKALLMLNPIDGTKPTSKKECCQFLGISYNTSRLDTILSNYVEKKQYAETRRKENKGKPASASEISFAISSYVASGESIDSIAKSLFRSNSFVKNILVSNGVTIRPVTYDYFNPALVPEGASKDRFSIGEIAFCTRYNVNCEIRAEIQDSKNGFVYRVWLLGDQQQFAHVAAYDLASLEHLKEYGLVVNG